MKASRSNRRNKLILLSLTALLGIGLLVFLFSAAGPFIRFGRTDLKFLLTPLLLLLVFWVMSIAIRTVFPSTAAALLAVALKYGALAFSTFLIVERATLFSRIPFLFQHLEILSTFRATAIYWGLFWVGLGLYQLAGLVAGGKKDSPGYQPLLFMLSFLVIGFSFWKTLDILGGYWSTLKGIGFVIGLSLIIVALTRLTAYITTPLTFLIESPLRWCLKYPVKLFWLSILIMLYFVFARPMVYSISPYAYLIEWVMICFVGYQILNLVKSNLKIRHATVWLEKDWRKHQQTINKIPDDDFNKMVILQEEFIESGVRRNLLVFLRQLLINNGVSESQISALLRPVIEYEDTRAHWFYRWFFKNRLVQGNRHSRIQVLEDSIASIRGAIYPALKYSTGVINERNSTG